MADDEGNGVGDNPPTRGVSMSSTDPVIDNSRRKLSKKELKKLKKKLQREAAAKAKKGAALAGAAATVTAVSSENDTEVVAPNIAIDDASAAAFSTALRSSPAAYDKSQEEHHDRLMDGDDGELDVLLHFRADSASEALDGDGRVPFR